MRKWTLCLTGFVAFTLTTAAPAVAQNAQVMGTITDESGGVIPGATISARNEETGLTRIAVTDHLGNYRLQALPPGTYAVATELLGFHSETRSQLVLVIDQTAIINFVLRPATLQETVTVTGEAPIVDTTRSDVSTSVSSAQIQDLPVASRRWIDLALLVPGTSQDNIRDQFYRGNVNLGAGTREYSNMFIVDGVNNTWAEMGEARQNFAMDSIREFKVSTSNYKAEHGLATGGLLTVVSKSGTNEVRGSGLLFFRDKALTTRTFFEEEKPDFRRYQYGGSVGGPIVRDKTHFFYAFERTDENQYFTVSTRGVWPDHDGTYLSDQWRWTYTAKVDHQLSQGQSMFARYARENEYRPIVTARGTTAPSASFDFAVPRDSAVVAHTWVMGDRVLNDFRFQYGFSKYILSPPFSNGNWGPGDFPADRVSLFTPEFRYPSLSIGSANTQMGPERRWQFKNDFSYLIPDWGGSHQWKMGVDYNYITFQADGSGGTAGNWTFPRDAPYNANDPTTWPTQYTDRLPDYGDVPVHWLSTYVQDDWQPARGLTVNLGMRWDLQIGNFNEVLYEDLLPRVAKKLGPEFGSYPLPIPFHERDPITGSPYGARGDWNNVAPRIGLAWDPSTDGRNNIHAGYGLFYESIRTLTTSFGEIRWPQAKTVIIRNPSFPDPYQGRSREEFITTAPPNISVLSNDFVNPYAHQFNVGLTRMVSRNLAATVDVSWVDRYSDRDITDINLPDPVTRQRPYPQFSRVSYSQSSSNNTHRALMMKIEKRLADSYQFMVSYTLSKAEDIAVRNVEAEFYGFRPVTSIAVADRRHRLVLSGIVQLPLDVQLSGIADFRTSLPFNPTTSFDLNGDGYTGDLPPGVGFMSGCRGLNLDGVNAFRASRRLAAVSPDDVACPGFVNYDIRVSKFFRIRTDHRLELIGQLFNIANRANFAPPVANPTAQLFGQVTQLPSWINAPSRQVEVALRYHF